LPTMITHDADGDEYVLYTKFSLQDAAVRKYGSKEEMDKALARVNGKRSRRRVYLQMKGWSPGTRPLNNNRLAGTKAVYTAMAANSAIFAMKAGAAVVTGSGSMMSEAVHSLVDVMNQGLLATGLSRANRAAGPRNPYGFGHEMYVFSMLAGVGTFFLGSGVAIWHGVSCFLHPHPLETPLLALAVLGGAGVLEGYTLRIAYDEIKHECAKVNMGFKQYLIDGPDPINTAVFLEDAVAVSGVGIAGLGVGLTMMTGDPVYDAVGSIAVGGLLGGVSAFLIQKNVTLLGQPVPLRTGEVVKMIEADHMVFSIQDVKSQQLQPGVCRIKAEVHFNPWALCDRYLDSDGNLGQITGSCLDISGEEETRRFLRRYSRMYMITLSMELDRIESMVRKKYPEFRHIDLEVL